ncbi:MAG TPA: polymer-forming cytoskeletal protein [Blastocatellia bacterium]|nr:polymer-forming cytoskeletal protein [Blastocatellia bacterium]
MKFGKNGEIGNDNAIGLIGKGVEVSGDIAFSDGLRVEGRVSGSLVSDGGTLIVEQAARIEARVDVGICVISGTVEGNVTAKSRVEVHKTARVRGDITTPVLLVEEGAVLNGNVGMGSQSGSHLVDSTLTSDEEDQVRVKGA